MGISLRKFQYMISFIVVAGVIFGCGTPRQNATTTPVPIEMPTSTVELKPTETPMLNKDGAEIVIIPAGEFIMGSDPNEPYFWGAEMPRHTVYLDVYSIYRYEVTNKQYRACDAAAICPEPIKTFSSTRSDYYMNPAYDNYPVIYVTYPDALAYCKWAGGTLPTEAQWEKAARGTDGRLFPWGDAGLTGSLANFCDAGCTSAEAEVNLHDGYSDTAPVGSFPAGASPYGLMDMAGNAIEWVHDIFGAEYYRNQPTSNPIGPAKGSRHVIRGGSWRSGRSGLRTSARASLLPDNSFETLGFRCVLSSP